MTLSVALITKNEEKNIEACLESVAWADEIVIVDSGSTDRTVEIAKRYTRHVYQKSFERFDEQKNDAMRRATKDWILFIDADERVSKELAAEVQKASSAGSERKAYAIKRITYFLGGKMKFSGTQTDYPVRLFPRGAVRYAQPVHEEIKTELEVRRIQTPLLHYSTATVEEYRRKLNQYVALETEHMKEQGRKAFFWDPFLRPPLKFVQLYLIQLGILDGRRGFLFALFSSYYAYLKYRDYLKLCR